jgi:hypothetical protein
MKMIHTSAFALSDSEDLRQFRREHEEFTIRFLQAQRDYPGLRHDGTQASIVNVLPTTNIKRDFERRG